MYEIELKFIIPENKVTAVNRQMSVKTAQHHQLDAYYFDTAEQLLGKAGIALRIRNENGSWVQTLKAKADGIAKRLEENIPLDLPARVATSKLMPDLTLHSKAIQKLLSQVQPLPELENALTLKFATKVKRITREITRYGNKVEIAFDEGKIISGRKSVPICEVEFELLAGNIDFLIDTANTWVKRHQLHYSILSKAGAGARLYQSRQENQSSTKSAQSKLVKANLKPFTAHKATTQEAFVRMAVQNCLQHILPNITELANSTPPAQFSDHVHQARVGMRRLRTVLKSFASFSPDIQPAWETQLKHTFTQLGNYRDRDILKNSTQPFLESQGSPVIHWQLPEKSMVQAAVVAPDFQQMLLALIAFAASTPQQHESSKQPKAKAALADMLEKLFKRIAKDSSRFAKLENEQQHDVRKRLKKLRYLCDFAAPVFASKKSKPKAFLQYLEPAQDVLGEFNDAAVGYAAYLALTSEDPKAWFAVGYFTAAEKTAAKHCANALQTVKFAPKFW